MLDGIDACISLTKAYPLFPVAAKAQLWLPIEDGPFPGLNWLRMAMRLVEAFRNNDMSVYIHCRAGISRSAMLTMAYLMREHNWSVDQAGNFLAEKNPSIDPNPRFLQGLREWHSFLRRQKAYQSEES